MSAVSWWMWVVLWSAVVGISAIVLGILAWTVWRRFAGAARELGELGATVELIEARSRQAAEQRAARAGRPRGTDVFTPWGEARLKYREDSHRRRSERMARRARRGQPQRVQDLQTARGKEHRNG
ncbi:hypothetical protein [Kocuria palustris]|uniref:hypothetical protein n=1 Tax=Kocuria palustris TaxID=71999 RepID=UPI0011AB2C23|nr:hypothetical protein [Kocuria palustris]